MPDRIIKEGQEKMQKAVSATKEKLSSIRAGRANVSMLDGITVLCYGAPTPLNQVATLSSPEPRTLTISPWDKSLIKEIEKGIQQSNLGLNPTNDGEIVRISIPELTAERRKEYVKLAKQELEDGKVAIRNIRKDINNQLRKLEKGNEISEDDLKLYEETVQEETDKHIKQLEELFKKKEKDITTI